MRTIAYTDELARELLKLPRMPICASEDGKSELRDDKRILSVFIRGDGTCLLKCDNFNTNGELKYFAE